MIGRSVDARERGRESKRERPEDFSPLPAHQIIINHRNVKSTAEADVKNSITLILTPHISHVRTSVIIDTRERGEREERKERTRVAVTKSNEVTNIKYQIFEFPHPHSSYPPCSNTYVWHF